MKLRHQMRVLGMEGRVSQDCAEVRELEDGRLRVALADGVGGQAGGREAALQATELWMNSDYAPEIQMAEADSLLSRVPNGGTTTAIYLQISATEVVGASVGDSQVWFQEASGHWRELTEYQRIRPFLGSGEAIPIPFSRVMEFQGRLLVCSDGLWRQPSREKMLRLAAQDDAEELLLSPRMPIFKSYADDVSFVLVTWNFPPP